MPRKLNRDTAETPQTRPVRVLQFGGGNFLRGFAEFAIDVLNEKTSFDGAVDIVTSVTPGTAEKINAQQGLYHLVQQGSRNGKPVSETRLITCVNRAINPAADREAFFAAARNPQLRFVISNTTEAGIAFDEEDASPEHLARSFPGKLTQLLYERFRHFNGSADQTLIVLPCELIESNGEVLRSIVYRYAAKWNVPPAFTAWIEKNTFCNTLVDRIVPGFPKDSIPELEENTGFEDKLAVAAEPFYFWAIEGPDFVAREFPAKAAGLVNVVFTNDIAPYRQRKVRILNGAHTAMVPVAYLRGIRTVKEAMDDDAVARFVREAIYEEIIPTLSMPRGELEAFATDVEDRFRNPFIRHMLTSIALNSVSKFRVRILPTIIDYTAQNKRLPQRLVTSLAALICFYRGSWKEELIPLNDSAETVSLIQRAWQHATVKETAKAILSSEMLWGRDLTEIPGMTDTVAISIKDLLR